MEIAFHLGSHCTDEGAVLRVLQRNRPMLAEQSIHIPPPEAYPALLRLAAQGFAGREITQSDRSALLEHLLPSGPAPERLVLSFESFLGFAQDAASPAALYPATRARAKILGDIFAGQALEVALCLRNPATLLPALSAKRVAKGLPPLSLAPEAPLRWTSVINELRAALPKARITLWCDEDAPLIWHSVLRSLAGFDEASELSHVLDYPASFLPQDEEVQRDMAAWFASQRPDRDSARREALHSWLSRHAKALPRVETGLPGWTKADIAAITTTYDSDCAELARRPGIRFLLP